MTNGAINETLRQFAPLSGDTLEVWWDLFIITKFSPDSDSEIIFNIG